MRPYTVWLQHEGKGPPYVHRVMARNRVAAYMAAVRNQEIYLALGSYPVGKLSLEQAAEDWPLLMVCEGHYEMEAVLSAADLFQVASEELEMEAI